MSAHTELSWVNPHQLQKRQQAGIVAAGTQDEVLTALAPATNSSISLIRLDHFCIDECSKAVRSLQTSCSEVRAFIEPQKD